MATQLKDIDKVNYSDQVMWLYKTITYLLYLKKYLNLFILKKDKILYLYIKY